MVPDLDSSESQSTIPRGGKDCGNGYVLLRAKDKVLQAMRPCEKHAFAAYLTDVHALQIAEHWSPEIARWARLRLPNGQIARSSWKEQLKPLEKVRMARNVKVCISSDFSESVS
jgi:hypothetical protein